MLRCILFLLGNVHIQLHKHDDRYTLEAQRTDGLPLQGVTLYINFNVTAGSGVYVAPMDTAAGGRH